MFPEIINEMLDALKPAINSRKKAHQRLTRYWADKMALIWTTRAVHRAANEQEVALSEAEARRILLDLHQHHNAQYGIRWEDLTALIKEGVLGRDLTKAETKRFVESDIITIRSRREKDAG